MKTIFDRETEIGQCEYETGLSGLREGPPELGTIYAHTKAYLSGSQKLLKLEQRCFVRLGEVLPEELFTKPELTLEAAMTPGLDIVQRAMELHERYVARMRARCADELPLDR